MVKVVVAGKIHKAKLPLQLFTRSMSAIDTVEKGVKYVESWLEKNPERCHLIPPENVRKPEVYNPGSGGIYRIM